MMCGNSDDGAEAPRHENPNEQIRVLVERWCDRREYAVLNVVLPAWLGNSGLTDGWAMLRDALKRASVFSHLPPDERALLKDLHVSIDIGLRQR